MNVKLRCFQSTRKLQSWFSIKDRQALLNRFNVVYKLTCSCGASYIGQTQRNLINRIEEHRTSLSSSVRIHLQANANHRVVFHNPEVIGSDNNWRRLQILESLLIQEHKPRAECKYPVDASMHFELLTELHASLMTSRAITIGAYPAESCDYVCFAQLRHYRNSPLRFSFITALSSWMTNENLQHDHCSSICNALMMITGLIETFAICRLYRFLWPWFSL